jgi:hypothetical protein
VTKAKKDLCCQQSSKHFETEVTLPFLSQVSTAAPSTQTPAI